LPDTKMTRGLLRRIAIMMALKRDHNAFAARQIMADARNILVGLLGYAAAGSVQKFLLIHYTPSSTISSMFSVPGTPGGVFH